MSTGPHMNELRQQLLATLSDLRDRAQPMEPDRARAVAQVASVLVDTAKVEVEYLRATGQQRSDFLEAPVGVLTGTPTPHNPFPTGITAVRRHTLEG